MEQALYILLALIFSILFFGLFIQAFVILQYLNIPLFLIMLGSSCIFFGHSIYFISKIIYWLFE